MKQSGKNDPVESMERLRQAADSVYATAMGGAGSNSSLRQPEMVAATQPLRRADVILDAIQARLHVTGQLETGGGRKAILALRADLIRAELKRYQRHLERDLDVAAHATMDGLLFVRDRCSAVATFLDLHGRAIDCGAEIDQLLRSVRTSIMAAMTKATTHALRQLHSPDSGATPEDLNRTTNSLQLKAFSPLDDARPSAPLFPRKRSNTEAQSGQGHPSVMIPVVGQSLAETVDPAGQASSNDRAPPVFVYRNGNRFAAPGLDERFRIACRTLGVVPSAVASELQVSLSALNLILRGIDPLPTKALKSLQSILDRCSAKAERKAMSNLLARAAGNLSEYQ